MAKRIIECQVNDEYINGAGVVVGAAGSHDDVVLRLRFDEYMWGGLNIYATFRNALGEEPRQTLLVSTMLVDGETMTYDVPIPAAAKRVAGKMQLTLTGYSVSCGAQVDTATNTVTAAFRVLASDFAMLDDESIDATVAQQLHNAINETNKRINDLNSSFATDEELQEGVKSAKGVSGNITLNTSQWANNENGITATHIFADADLGENDLILFSPAEAADKEEIMACDLFIQPESIDKTVTFYAAKMPNKNITLFYFITRGG